jgi:hypothetical protein
MKMKNRAIELHNNKNDKKREWFSAMFEFATDSKSHIDGEILKDGLICTAGKARGHDVWLDNQFILDLESQSKRLKTGIKARFGHPNMCASGIGTTLGRWKDCYVDDVEREDGSNALALRGDLHFSKAAHKAPQGDLVEYVQELATQDGDLFGSSIVAEMNGFFKKTTDGTNAYQDKDGDWVFDSGESLNSEDLENLSEETYAELYKFMACDIVDEPAANDGMFSAFSSDSVAGQITEFLNQYPQIIDQLSQNPLIMETIKKYPGEIDGFIERYNNNKGNDDMTKELEEAQEVVEPAEIVEEPAIVAESLSVEEFSKIKEEFGTDIVATIFESGGKYEDALSMAFKQSKEDVEALTADKDSLSKELKTAKTEIAELSEKLNHYQSLPDGKVSDFSTPKIQKKCIYNQEAK